MKVLIAATGVYKMGGMQRAIIALANDLSNRGHDILLAGESSKNSNPYYKVNKKVNLINIKSLITKYKKINKRRIKNIKRILFINSKFNNSILSEDYYNSITWQLNYINRIDAWRELCLHSTPDIVLGVLPNTFTILSIALENSEIPLIINNHNNPWRDYSLERWDPNPMDLKYRLEAPNKAAANTVLLPEFKDFFSKEVQQKTYIIPNVVEPTEEDNRAIPQNNTGIKTIIATGRLAPVKDHMTLIKAFAELRDEFPDWQVKIFGEGPLKKQLSQEIRDNDLSGKVFLCDHTDRLYEEYSMSQILAIPSHFEGWGLSLTEAMAHGLPAIGFDNASGINTLIQHDLTGFLADGNNRIKSFKDNLKILMKDGELRQKMGVAAINQVEKYNPEHIYSLWEKILLEIKQKHLEDMRI